MYRVSAIILILLGTLLPGASAFAETEQPPALSEPPGAQVPASLLEVTGTLEDVLPGKQGEVVTLNVYGKIASGPLSSDCRFLDEQGAPMEKSAFLQRYMKRVVTLELEADSGAVVLFRVGS